MQVSRNLFQYFSADSLIVDGKDGVTACSGNIISISIGEEGLWSSPDDNFPIQLIKSQGLRIYRPGGYETIFEFEAGLGAIFLKPLPDERLELIIWGFDELGLRLAARLLPLLTGVGQPEFNIVSNICAWEGAGGVLAMGSFDSSWNVSETSFVV